MFLVGASICLGECLSCIRIIKDILSNFDAYITIVTAKENCLHKYNPIKDIDKNKTMKVNENWNKL